MKKITNFLKIDIYFLFILIIIKLYLFELFYISSSSMEPVFLKGDLVLVNKIINIPIINYFYSLNKNDIIAFLFPINNKKKFVKRIVGIYNNKYFLYKGGKKCIKNYLYIPKNYFFVTGDNINNSYDSRYWGLLNKKHIIGTVKFKIFNIYKIFNYFNKIKNKICLILIY